MVTSTCGSFAKCMARVLFIVDKPPLDDPHSFARRVTFNINVLNDLVQHQMMMMMVVVMMEYSRPVQKQKLHILK